MEVGGWLHSVATFASRREYRYPLRRLVRVSETVRTFWRREKLLRLSNIILLRVKVKVKVNLCNDGREESQLYATVTVY